MSLVLAMATAPIQCGSDPEPSQALEETPGEALYLLAEEFRAAGDHDAAQATLRHLIKRYPSSRFAKRAQIELEEARPKGGASPGRSR